MGLPSRAAIFPPFDDLDIEENKMLMEMCGEIIIPPVINRFKGIACGHCNTVGAMSEFKDKKLHISYNTHLPFGGKQYTIMDLNGIECSKCENIVFYPESMEQIDNSVRKSLPPQFDCTIMTKSGEITNFHMTMNERV